MAQEQCAGEKGSAAGAGRKVGGMSVKCSNGCGRETNTGICCICRQDAALAGTPIETETKTKPRKAGTLPKVVRKCPGVSGNEGGEKEMANEGVVMSEKICIDCKKTYKPTSNVQKRCEECREKKKNSKAGTVPAKRSTKVSRKVSAKVKAILEKPAAPQNGGGHIETLKERFSEHEQEMVNICGALRTIERACQIEIPGLPEMEARLL
jgi:hypothetical protein